MTNTPTTAGDPAEILAKLQSLMTADLQSDRLGASVLLTEGDAADEPREAEERGAALSCIVAFDPETGQWAEQPARRVEPPPRRDDPPWHKHGAIVVCGGDLPPNIQRMAAQTPLFLHAENLEGAAWLREGHPRAFLAEVTPAGGLKWICGARARSRGGLPCRSKHLLAGFKCKRHGGMSTGPRRRFDGLALPEVVTFDEAGQDG